MGEAIFLSSIFGPYLLIMGLWMLVHRKNYEKIGESISKTPMAIYIVGWTSLLIGLVIISTYDVWEWDALVFVTLLGWAYLVRALIVLFMPQLYLKAEAHKKSWIKLGGIIRFVWGILLCWIALRSM